MKTKYDAYNSWVSFFIVTCETLITGGLFYLLFLTTEDTHGTRFCRHRTCRSY